MRLRPIMASVITLSLAALAGESQAASFQFQGSTQANCLEDTAGFDANLQPNPLPAIQPPGSTNFIRQSWAANFPVFTFNADGTFTTQNTSSGFQTTLASSVIQTTPTSFDGETTSTCSGTFVVSPSLSVTSNESCTFQEMVPQGNSGTTTGIQRVFQATQGLGHLMISTPHPSGVETVHVTRPNGTSFTYERVCAVAGSASHLGP